MRSPRQPHARAPRLETPLARHDLQVCSIVAIHKRGAREECDRCCRKSKRRHRSWACAGVDLTRSGPNHSAIKGGNIRCITLVFQGRGRENAEHPDQAARTATCLQSQIVRSCVDPNTRRWVVHPPAQIGHGVCPTRGVGDRLSPHFDTSGRTIHVTDAHRDDGGRVYRS
jgi:hypothetical protein